MHCHTFLYTRGHQPPAPTTTQSGTSAFEKKVHLLLHVVHFAALVICRFKFSYSSPQTEQLYLNLGPVSPASGSSKGLWPQSAKRLVTSNLHNLSSFIQMVTIKHVPFLRGSLLSSYLHFHPIWAITSSTHQILIPLIASPGLDTSSSCNASNHNSMKHS